MRCLVSMGVRFALHMGQLAWYALARVMHLRWNLCYEDSRVRTVVRSVRTQINILYMYEEILIRSLTMHRVVVTPPLCSMFFSSIGDRQTLQQMSSSPYMQINKI
jgi:hypothetical protein